MSAKVFVGNLDFNTTKDEVQSLFSQIGEIRDVFLPMDRESGRPRGFAFVEFASDEDIANVVGIGAPAVGDGQLQVERAHVDGHGGRACDVEPCTRFTTEVCGDFAVERLAGITVKLSDLQTWAEPGGVGRGP